MIREFRKNLVIVIVSAIMLSFLISGCSSTITQAIISIDNIEFELGCKVNEIVDAGFQIGESDHVRSIYYLELPKIEANTTLNQEFYIFRDWIPSHVGICVINPSDKPAGLEDCIVYKFSYNCADYLDANIESTDVRLNSISFQFTDKKQVVESLESQGFIFGNNERAEFMTMSEENSKRLNNTQESSEYIIVICDIYDIKTDARLIDGFEISIKQG